jgi:hypothetical protein
MNHGTAPARETTTDGARAVKVRLDVLLQRVREYATRWPHWRDAIAWPRDGWASLPRVAATGVAANAIRRLPGSCWEQVLGLTPHGYQRFRLTQCTYEIDGLLRECGGYDDEGCPRAFKLADIMHASEDVAAEAAVCCGYQPVGTAGTSKARLVGAWFGHLFQCYGLPPDEVTAPDGGVWLIQRLSYPIFQATLSALEIRQAPIAAETQAATGEVAEPSDERGSTPPRVDESPPTPFAKLPKAVKAAYAVYKYAERENERAMMEDQAAYRWLKANGLPDDLGDYSLPDFSSWSRYLRKARKALGEQKHSSRQGRPVGRSIVRVAAIDVRAKGGD